MDTDDGSREESTERVQRKQSITTNSYWETSRESSARLDTEKGNRDYPRRRGHAREQSMQNSFNGNISSSAGSDLIAPEP